MVCDRLRTQTSPTAASSLPRHAYAFEGVHTTRADPSARSHPARYAIRAESQLVAAVRIRSHSGTVTLLGSPCECQRGILGNAMAAPSSAPAERHEPGWWRRS